MNPAGVVKCGFSVPYREGEGVRVMKAERVWARGGGGGGKGYAHPVRLAAPFFSRGDMPGWHTNSVDGTSARLALFHGASTEGPE